MTDSSLDHQRRNHHRGWGALLALCLTAALASTIAYNVGLSQGVARVAQQAVAGQAGQAAPPIVYYAPRPWGFGFLFPLVVLPFWFLVARLIFWRGRRGHRSAGGPGGRADRFDQWHRQAHERMGGHPSGTNPADQRG
jgi:hypothetical protein